MNSGEGWLRARDDTRLLHRWWLPPGRERTTLAVVHGVGEHGGRYAPFAELLTARSVAVHVADLRGHGRSDGARVHVKRWSDYRSDLAVFLGAVGSAGPSTDPLPEARAPLFLFGHSLGALIALDYALGVERGSTGEPGIAGAGSDRSAGRSGADGPAAGTASDGTASDGTASAGTASDGPGVGSDSGDPLPAGLISSSTAIDPRGVAKPYLVAIARLLSRVTPRASLDLGIDPEALSRDPAVVRAYAEDPLVHRRATVRWGTEVLSATASIRRRAARLHMPLLVCHGTADRLTSPEGSRWLAEVTSGATGADVELKLFAEAYHEPHNDTCAAEVAAYVAGWMEAHTA